jgi:dienelactone hydrolase
MLVAMVKITKLSVYGHFAALWAVLGILSPPMHAVAATEEPFRILSPTGGASHPAVLLVPGCSGFTTTNGVNLYEERAAELQAAGYVVVFVDYIGRRMQNNCAHVSQAEMSADILEATTWVRHRTDVDPSRISVIGWSYGGGGVFAALKTMPTPPTFTKVVLYYPVCRGATPWSAAVTGLMLLGEKDDIAFPTLCGAVAKGVSSDRLLTITYPNARHGFDMRGLPDGSQQPSGAPGYNAYAAKGSWIVVLDFLNGGV